VGLPSLSVWVSPVLRTRVRQSSGQLHGGSEAAPFPGTTNCESALMAPLAIRCQLLPMAIIACHLPDWMSLCWALGSLQPEIASQHRAPSRSIVSLLCHIRHIQASPSEFIEASLRLHGLDVSVFHNLAAACMQP
jgi:hypothetical protein